MTSEPEERHIGVPSQKPRAADGRGAGVNEVLHFSPAGSSTVRPDSSDEERLERKAGLPVHTLRQPTEAYDPHIHGEDLPDGEDDDADGFAEPTDALWRSVLFQPIVVSITTLLAAGLLLMLVSEVFQFLQAVQSAPRPLKWLGYLIVALLVSLATWAAFRLVRCVTALRVTPRVLHSDYGAARNRPFVRKAVRQKTKEGVEILRAIVAEYPLDDPHFRKLMSSCGGTQESLSLLRREIQDLRSDNELTFDSWVNHFDKRVLAVIDQFAKKRVSTYANRVAVKTAVMPTSMADMLIVVTNSLLMLKDLCALYNVRTTPLGTCSLAAQLFMNVFVASRLEKQLSSFAEGASSAVPDAVAVTTSADGVVSSAGAIGAAASSAGKAVTTLTMGVGQRVAEGAANRFLISKLGSACIQYLRPVQQ